ncbi:fimbrial protein [Serratia marcescens]|nr:fimbrial protein [Serratia marcescens]TXE43919.1 fimbrial protein [Serratia marcescens]
MIREEVMMRTFLLQRCGWFACLAPLLVVLPGEAAQTAPIPIDIKATVVIPPCTINSGQAIDVLFGNVEISDVNNDGSNAVRSVVKTVPVICPPGIVDSNALKVTVSGTTAGATNRLVTSESTGAGIGLYQGSVLTGLTPLTVGMALPLSGMGSVTGSYDNGYNGELTFSARVEKASNGVNVVPGDFSATATMVVEQM